jgi:DNA-binding response OmpR family regulator
MTNTAAKILVVDDELPNRMTMSDILRRRGYEVLTAESGEEALALIHQQPFDLLLLDLKMPGLSGIDVAKRTRELQFDTAMIILTGHGSLESAIDGLHLGVFDYMLKTSSPQEVVARVEAAITQRRNTHHHHQLLEAIQSAAVELGGGKAPEPRPHHPAESYLSINDLQISTWKQTVRRGNETLSLTPTEFRVLLCLAQQAGQVMTYQQLLQGAQGYEADPLEAAELVKPHIYHLRQKIEPDPSNPHYILTVRGTGYLLATHQEPEALP